MARLGLLLLGLEGVRGLGVLVASNGLLLVPYPGTAQPTPKTNYLPKYPHNLPSILGEECPSLLPKANVAFLLQIIIPKHLRLTWRAHVSEPWHFTSKCFPHYTLLLSSYSRIQVPLGRQFGKIGKMCASLCRWTSYPSNIFLTEVSKKKKKWKIEKNCSRWQLSLTRCVAPLMHNDQKQLN